MTVVIRSWLAFQGFSWLDSYLFASTELADRALDVRFGRQALSWGESTFIQGGINVVSPLDQSAFNRPGVEIKEGLLPVEMLQASYELGDGLSVEGFYQFNWRPSVIDGCGTFFAITDAIQPGCGPVYTSALFIGVRAVARYRKRCACRRQYGHEAHCR